MVCLTGGEGRITDRERWSCLHDDLPATITISEIFNRRRDKEIYNHTIANKERGHLPATTTLLVLMWFGNEDQNSIQEAMPRRLESRGKYVRDNSV